EEQYGLLADDARGGRRAWTRQVFDAPDAWRLRRTGDYAMTISDLSVTVDDGKTSVVPGVNYDGLLFQPPPFAGNDYTVTVTSYDLNINPGAGLTWAGTQIGGIVGTLIGGFNSWSWSGLSLASGQSVSTTFVYSIDPNATGPITLTFTVSPPAGTTDPTPINDSFTDSDTATPQADLAVTMTDGKTTVVPGTSNTYTLTVTNTRPSTVSTL